MERLPASIAAVAAGVAAAVWYAKRRCTTRAHAITSDTYGIASKDEPSKDEPSEHIVGVQPSVDEAVPLWQTTNAAGTFSLVDALIDSDDAFLDVVRLMPAVSAARLAKTSHAAHAFILQPHVANWAAESRRHLLQRRNVPGTFRSSRTATGPSSGCTSVSTRRAFPSCTSASGPTRSTRTTMPTG